jgi:hypothetical protein
MKAFVFAAVGAVALLAAAPAMAATGYVGAQYTRDQLDGKGTKDADIFGAEGAVAFDASKSLGIDLDASYADGDQSDGVTAGTAHLYGKAANYKFGGFVGIADVDSDQVYSVGVEGQVAVTPKTTLAAAIGYANDDDANVDLYGVDAEARYFLTDNFRINGKLGWANIDAGKGADDDLYSIGVGGEYQLSTTPISFTAGYTHSEFDTADLKSDAFSVGIRYNWGGSLKDRDTNGPSFSGLSSLTGALGL